MTKEMRGLVVDGICFFQPLKEMWVKRLWNMNKFIPGILEYASYSSGAIVWASYEGRLMVLVSLLWIADLS